MGDSRRTIVHLYMNWATVVVRLVLMPPDQQTSLRLNPVEPVTFVPVACFAVETHPRYGPLSQDTRRRRETGVASHKDEECGDCNWSPDQ